MKRKPIKEVKCKFKISYNIVKEDKIIDVDDIIVGAPDKTFARKIFIDAMNSECKIIKIDEL